MRTSERDRDGSTHVVLEPWDLLAKLAALIPPTKREAVKKLRFAENTVSISGTDGIQVCRSRSERVVFTRRMLS
jgi:hypothetical protein